MPRKDLLQSPVGEGAVSRWVLRFCSRKLPLGKDCDEPKHEAGLG